MTYVGCVLVVDDDPAIREMLAEYLGAHGFRVVQASAPAGLPWPVAPPPLARREVAQAPFAWTPVERPFFAEPIPFVREPVPGDWKVLTSSHPPVKADAHTIEFTVSVPAKLSKRARELLEELAQEGL